MDAFDFDRFLNLDQMLSPSAGPSSSSHKTAPNPTPMPTQDQVNQDHWSMHPISQQQIWSRPSHQYDLHRQQAGLPVGALANTIDTTSLNQYSNGQKSFPGFSTTVDGSLGLNTTNELDFDLTPTQISAGAQSSMDFDFNSPLNDNATFESDFGTVDPNAIDGPEEPSQHRLRVYPGIHTQQAQQAAEAKAQAESQRKTQQSQGRQAAPRANGKPLDPIVEESISRVLNQMRHNSVVSASESHISPPSGGASHASRTKKEEEDMDEDERLLASEEGKKLSSKERRQLRNKVSARAFRSRRKEYIGQLEGEIAQKAQEADDLRAMNEKLMAENKRLTDFTQVMLSSPSFSSFLREISQTGSSASNVLPPSQSPVKAESQEVSPNSATFPQLQTQQDVNPHVGMTFVPEPRTDYGNHQSHDNSWVDENDTSLYDAQVFAVTSIPEGPAFEEVDVTILSGKPSKETAGSFFTPRAKSHLPEINFIPATKEDSIAMLEASNADAEDLEPDDLYSTSSKHAKLPMPISSLSPGLVSQKSSSFRLVVEESSTTKDVDGGVTERFELLCAALDDLSASIARITSNT